jgi:thiamine-monophosphate kinase
MEGQVAASGATELEPPTPDPSQREQQVIDMLLAQRGAPPSWVDLDAGDDAAVLSDGTAVTVDALVEGVHFDERLSAEDVGFKTLAVSVSDLGAVGARPRWAVLALSLPRADEAWCAGFARGLREACARWGVYLLGGDTTGVPVGGPRVASLTLVGRCAQAPLARSGGRRGDRVWVTGTLGLAGAGWRLDAPPPEALQALRRPAPPLELALRCAASGLVHAAMDLSDGLAVDLPRLCAASGTGAAIGCG